MLLDNVDVGDLLDAVGVRNQELAKDSAVLKGINAEVQRNQEVQVQTVRDVGANNEIIKGAEVAATKKAQEQTAKFANRMGTNIDESGEIMTTLAEGWKEATFKAIEQRKVVQDKLATKLLDNPLKYVYDQFTLEDSVLEADAANATVGQYAKALTEAQTQTQQFAVTANAIKQTATGAAAVAAISNVRIEAERAEADLRIQQAGTNIQGILTVQQLSAQQISNLATGVSAKQSEAQLTMATERLNMERVNHKFQVEQWTAKLEKDRLEKQDEEQIANFMRYGLSAGGFPNADKVPTSKAVMMLKLKDPIYLKALEIGMASDTMKHPVISDKSGEVAQMVVDHGAPLQATQQNIRSLLKSAYTDVAQGAKVRKADGTPLDFDPTKKDQVVMATSALVAERAKGNHDNIKFGDSTNIYAPPPLKAVTALPGVQETRWYKEVLKDQMAAGGLNEFNSEQLVGLTAAALKAKKITFAEASFGLGVTHAAAMAINNTTKNYVGLGIPRQTGFNVRLETGFGLSQKFDFTKDVDINRILASKIGRFKYDTETPAMMTNPITP